MIRFLDGRPFVNLDLSTGSWHGAHTCGSDRQLVTTVARSLTWLEERWNVRGPRAQYDAVTTLERQPNGGTGSVTNLDNSRWP